MKIKTKSDTTPGFNKECYKVHVLTVRSLHTIMIILVYGIGFTNEIILVFGIGFTNEIILVYRIGFTNEIILV